MTYTEEDFERVQEARKLFRLGVTWLDALGRVGLPEHLFPYQRYVTQLDEVAHDASTRKGIES